MRQAGTGAMMAAALLLLAACGSEPGVPGETPEESAELNNAAAMLDTETLDASPDSLAVGENVAIETESGGAVNAQ